MENEKETLKQEEIEYLINIQIKNGLSEAEAKANVYSRFTDPKENTNSTEHFINNHFYASVDKYNSYDKKRTGFVELDKTINGMLPALYLVGAVSSIGKTTFALQMADNIARNGNDVLYFSLEQSKFELISKSLSRIAYTDLRENVTAKEIMYNTNPDITTQCIISYAPIGKRLFIYEGNFDTSVQEIETEIKKHIDITGNNPVVIIDYLQVIKGEGISDKNIIDTIVTTLKRVSRNLFIPIFVISALNRANYLNPISFESFKESGSIEYTADTLIGLQYQKVHDIQDMPTNKLSQKRLEMKWAINGDKDDNFRRDIELVFLKNRHGKQQHSIQLAFYPGQNYFMENTTFVF